MEVVPLHSSRAGVADDAEIHFVGQVAGLNPDTGRTFDDTGIIPVVDRNKPDAGKLFLHLSDPLLVTAETNDTLRQVAVWERNVRRAHGGFHRCQLSPNQLRFEDVPSASGGGDDSIRSRPKGFKPYGEIFTQREALPPLFLAPFFSRSVFLGFFSHFVLCFHFQGLLSQLPITVTAFG